MSVIHSNDDAPSWEYDYGPCTNTAVYGLEESIRRAKLPMSVNPETLNTELTPRISSLARSEQGSGHDQWLTGVIVQMDVKFTIKAWTEAERYHFFDFVSSQSTMHRITRFDLDEAYCEYVDHEIVERMRWLVHEYNVDPTPEKYLRVLYSNPCGMYLTAGITTNYRQLKTIYAQRRNHRLPEWREFCKWIEGLPLAKELICGGEK